MMWYWGGGVQWWGWLLMSLGMVVFWGLVIWVIWYFVTNMINDARRGSQTGAAKHILDERLARGEIDAEEYRRLRDLMRTGDLHDGTDRTSVGVGER
jgi:putative membrane protein